jgi:hypothetical protein
MPVHGSSVKARKMNQNSPKSHSTKTGSERLFLIVKIGILNLFALFLQSSLEIRASSDNA